MGPTSDDVTRDAVAIAVQQPLLYRDDVWTAVQESLKRLGIEPDESNCRQAFFPQEATVLDNPRGTAPGFYLESDKTKLVILPGPPVQANALLTDYLAKEYNVSVINRPTIRSARVVLL